MTLKELSIEYAESAEPLRLRIRQLNAQLRQDGLCETERLRLKQRVCTLGAMLRDTLETASYLRHYYGREADGKN